MRNVIKSALLLSVASALCFADSWTGKLIDASCKAKGDSNTQSMSCAATAATTAFGIELSDGRVLNLDADGNMKAAEALKTNKTSNQKVSVTGTLDNTGSVKVDSINIQE